MTGVLAISQQTFAILIVVALFGLFLLLLAGSFMRARKAAPATGAPAEAPAPKAPKPITRRDFFRGGLLGGFFLFLAQFGGMTLAFLYPSLKGGFGAVINAGTLSEIRNAIEESRQPVYAGAGRFYLVPYPVDPIPEVYDGVANGGLMALYQRCVHLGCRVPFCEQSQWFECPCHGSKYNRAGEYELGPAPTGLERFPIILDGETVMVDTGIKVPGPPRGTNTIRQNPEGPFCVAG
jgi:cytochrome b6-f complex iron-sulfur subunit